MPLRIFPVLGGANFSSEFNAVAREGMRQHLGNDLFAAERTPLLAVDDGIIYFGNDPLGGQVANLRANDGTLYYYAHLSAFAGDNRRQVRAGELIGYIGRTGNAASTSPHVHFEVHPGSGAIGRSPAVNPYPLLQLATRLQPTSPVASSDALRTLLPLAVLGTLGAGLWLWMRDNPSRIPVT